MTIRCSNPTCTATLEADVNRNRELYDALDDAGWRYIIDDGQLVVTCPRCTA